LEDKNLKPTFKSGRANVGVFAAIVKGAIFMRKWTLKEKTSERDKLDLNTAQYTNELHEPHLISFIEGLEDPPGHIYLAIDGASYHNGKKNKGLQEECGYNRLEWPPNSTQLRTAG
jgi:hypothetical protein